MSSLHLESSASSVMAQRRRHISVVRTSACVKRTGLSSRPCPALGIFDDTSALNSRTRSNAAATRSDERDSGPRLKFSTLIYCQEILLGFCLLFFVFVFFHLMFNAPTFLKARTESVHGSMQLSLWKSQGGQGESSSSWVASAAAEIQTE